MLIFFHQNPVKVKIVKQAEDYRFSSAIDYSSGKGLLDIENCLNARGDRVLKSRRHLDRLFPEVHIGSAGFKIHLSVQIHCFLVVFAYFERNTAHVIFEGIIGNGFQ